MPAPERRSSVGAPHKASLRWPEPTCESARSRILRLAPGILGAFRQFSGEGGRTSPAEVVTVHRFRPSCWERWRPWPEMIDLRTSAKGTWQRNLDELEDGLLDHGTILALMFNSIVCNLAGSRLWLGAPDQGWAERDRSAPGFRHQSARRSRARHRPRCQGI
jgi:hypothetical protein